jgi:hypothetical protein
MLNFLGNFLFGHKRVFSWVLNYMFAERRPEKCRVRLAKQLDQYQSGASFLVLSPGRQRRRRLAISIRKVPWVMRFVDVCRSQHLQVARYHFAGLNE